MCTQKMRALYYIGAEKNTFPPKPDIQTDLQTYVHTDIRKYRRTDFSVYRVASLLKNKLVCNSRNIDDEIKAIQEKLESLQMDIEHNQYLISRNELIINNVSYAQQVKSNNDKPNYQSNGLFVCLYTG